MISGLIFNIQKFSIHDGPGIRTLVFMKGCPLRCRWCCNPESQKRHPEISFRSIVCIGVLECGRCIDVCPLDAIGVDEAKHIRIDRAKCDSCGKCAEVCPAKALELIGEYVRIDHVMRVVQEDCNYYRRSGGGITVSGGEPLEQAGFVSELLSQCKGAGINTAIETCGQGDQRSLDQLCHQANLVFFDLKHMDPVVHRSLTGVGNELILENIRKISTDFPRVNIIVRTPIIPGYNDFDANIKASAEFVSGLHGQRRYELIPYHKYGVAKYAQLGRLYGLTGLSRTCAQKMVRLKRIVDDV